MFTHDELIFARNRIHEVFQGTPQYCWPLLCERAGAEVWTKHENHTPTGAFKVRGGLILVERILRDRLAPKGMISATRGNHGQSLAFAGRRFDVPVSIVVPHGNSAEKNEAMRAFGARLIEHGEDFEAARIEAMGIAERDGLWFAPSFHRDLVVGVATWAFELFDAVQDIDRLYVPIGLGSSICGAIVVRDLLGLSTEIVGVQSARAPAYAESFQAGRAVETPSADTNADGLAVRIPDPAALAIILNGASRIITVTDDEIADAVRAYWTDTHNLAEGAGAAALAAALKERVDIGGKRVAMPLSGGNIDYALFQNWISRR